MKCGRVVLSLLVDSSVWIAYFNGVINVQTDYLHRALAQEPLLVGDLILVEVLDRKSVV